jgi:hypothetical protein
MTLESMCFVTISLDKKRRSIINFGGKLFGGRDKVEFYKVYKPF